MSRLTLRFFGPPEVSRSDGLLLPPLRTRKGLWLLALLTLRAGKTVERGWLAEQLWPDATRESGLANLRRALTDLRSALGPDAAQLSSPTTTTLLFEAQGVDCDVLRFDATPEQEVALYLGELLEGCQEEWVFAERRSRQERYLQARLTRAASAPPPEARLHLQAALETDPLCEAAVRALMEVSGQLGLQSEGLQVYRHFRARLSAQRLQPDPQTRALSETLRAQFLSPASPPSPQAASTISLPVPLTSFVGRRQEKARVLEALQAGTRFITLLGPGGVGKTRLALAVAETLHPTGALQGFVDCSTVMEAGALPQALTRALELRVPEGSSHERVLWESLGEGVLFLDNLEQVQGSPGPFLRELLSRCGCLQLVVTSRTRLGLSGEMLLRLAGLSAEDAHALFLQRAQAAGAAPGGDDHRAIEALCARLDHLPLALELAAPWCEFLTIPELVARLEHRFALLQGKELQKGLEATLAWGWERLSRTQQQDLGCLSVLTGAWTLGAGAAALGREGEELSALASLADSSWLVIEPGKPPHYRLLESIRSFVVAQPSQGQQQAAQRRLLAWWELLSATQAEDTAHWLQVIHRDLESLRQTLEYCLLHPDEAERGLGLLDTTSVYFFFRGLSAECQARTERLLALVPTDSPSRARWLAVLSGCALRLGEVTQAQAYLGEALAVCRDRPQRAYLLGCLGVSLRKQGVLSDAERCHREALALYDEAGRTQTAAIEKMRLGVVYGKRGDDDQARQCFQEAITQGDILTHAGALAEWARLELLRGERAQAEVLFAEALALQQQLGNQSEVDALRHELSRAGIPAPAAPL